MAANMEIRPGECGRVTIMSEATLIVFTPTTKDGRAKLVTLDVTGQNTQNVIFMVMRPSEARMVAALLKDAAGDMPDPNFDWQPTDDAAKPAPRAPRRAVESAR